MNTFFTSTSLWRRCRRTTALLSRRTRLLVWCAVILVLLYQAAHLAMPLVTAQISNKTGSQNDGVAAPGTKVRPTSVSVINFGELAAQDSKAVERAGITPQVLQAIHPPMTIKEADSAALPTEAPDRKNLARP